MIQPTQNEKLSNRFFAIRQEIKDLIANQLECEFSNKNGGLTSGDRFALANGEQYVVPTVERLYEEVQKNFDCLAYIHQLHHPVFARTGRKSTALSILNVTCDLTPIPTKRKGKRAA